MHLYCSASEKRRTLLRSVLLFSEAGTSPDSNEVLGKNAEHFDEAFENGVFESRVWVGKHCMD